MREQDLFFHYTYVCSETEFEMLKVDQKLTIEFNDYPNLLIKIIKDCKNSPLEYNCILNVDSILKAEFYRVFLIYIRILILN